MHVCTYACMQMLCLVTVCLDSVNLFLVLSLCVCVSVIAWGHRSLQGCSVWPPRDRRDPPGPGGGHRGQDRGTQIQQPPIDCHNLTSLIYVIKS